MYKISFEPSRPGHPICPCTQHCVKRTPTCRSSCKDYKEYEKQMKIWYNTPSDYMTTRTVGKQRCQINKLLWEKRHKR